MHNRLILAICVLALAAGCGAKAEREAAERAAEAAEKKLAEARSIRDAAVQERQKLEEQVAALGRQTHELKLARNRALAAAAYVVDDPQTELRWTAEMSNARWGFRFEQATAAKDQAARDALLAEMLDVWSPCVTVGEQPETGTCQSEPFEDACVDVAAYVDIWPEWQCASLVRPDPKLPQVAFCTGEAQYPASAGGLASSYSEDGLHTSRALLRTAFLQGSQLVVQDWPPPEPSLYGPPNVTELAACKAATQRNECIYNCDDKHDRYNDPCNYQDPPDGDYDEYIEEDSDEPEAVREAKRAQAHAEAEAAYAQRRAQEAAEEVAYQQCRSACEPPEEKEETEESEEETADAPAPPREPTTAQVAAELAGTPAPGLFLVSERTHILDQSGETLEERHVTRLLRSPALVALLRGGTPEPGHGALEQVEAFSAVPVDGEGSAKLVPLAGKEQALVGVSQSSNAPAGYVFTGAAAGEPRALAPAEVCAAVKGASGMPAALGEACARLQVGAAPGVPDAGTPDAGLSGEVTP